MRPDPPTLTTFTNIFARAHRRYAEVQQVALAKVGLTQPQFDVLCHLAEADPTHWFRVGDLISQVDVQQSGISKIIRKFHRAELVALHPDDHDQRSKRFRITAEGYFALDQVYATIGPEIADWFTGWTTGQLEQFNTSIADLSRRMTAAPDEFIPWTV